MQSMSANENFDIAVIGSGPGGYIAAIRASQSGKSVALIEAGYMGGTCLNWGCIPTKTLLANAEVLHKIKHAEDYGISVGSVSFDFAKMKGRKDSIVERLRKGIEGLMTSNRITVIRGFGKFVSANEIKVLGDDNRTIRAEKIIIATGSEPRNMSAFPFDNKKIHSSTSILEWTELPRSLVIIGGGVIGCEFASLYAELGVQVVILELLPTIIATEGKNISDALTAAFKKKGIQILTEVMVEGVENTPHGVIVKIKDQPSIEADQALVAIGRKLNTDQIGLDKIGINVLPGGVIPVNDHMETSVPGIYAIGDITGKWMLAHVASHQGIVAAEHALGMSSKMHYNAVPSVIFTHPEIGSVGYTLEKALEKGYAAVAGKFPFQALGKSQASVATEGFAQVVVDKNTRQILGAQVVGYEASSLIACMALAIQNELTIESVTQTIHAHPTVAEVWLEAMFVAADMPIHLPPKAKKTPGKE
jgi:dihydrolipoamide dehydrogenase